MGLGVPRSARAKRGCSLEADGGAGGVSSGFSVLPLTSSSSSPLISILPPNLKNGFLQIPKLIVKKIQ